MRAVVIVLLLFGAPASVRCMHASLDAHRLLTASQASPILPVYQESIDDFVEQSHRFLTKMPASPARLAQYKNLAAGANADCIARMVRTCMGLGLVVRLQEDQRSALTDLELDQLDSKKRLVDEMHPRYIEPFSEDSITIASRKTQFRVWKFLTQAIQQLHAKNFLITQRMYLWAIENDAVTDAQIVRHNKYARRLCSRLFKTLAKPEKKQQQSCNCTIL